MREGREELTGHRPQLKASALPDEVGHLLELWDVVLAEMAGGKQRRDRVLGIHPAP